jgi:hypothetical protein
MARHDPIPSHARPGFTEPRGAMDDLIRPNLRRAFPLPATTEDEKFRALLAALAERGQGADQASSHARGY